jgi:hypothetical protein
MTIIGQAYAKDIVALWNDPEIRRLWQAGDTAKFLSGHQRGHAGAALC